MGVLGLNPFLRKTWSVKSHVQHLTTTFTAETAQMYSKLYQTGSKLFGERQLCCKNSLSFVAGEAQRTTRSSDGTLVTQRLHFAPMPHPYRHVLGWYRIIQELKESSISAICVFDGKVRSTAKQMEVCQLLYFTAQSRITWAGRAPT